MSANTIQECKSYKGFVEGSYAARKGRLCRIKKIHFEMHPPAVTVLMMDTDTEVGTEFDRLQRIKTWYCGVCTAPNTDIAASKCSFCKLPRSYKEKITVAEDTDREEPTEPEEKKEPQPEPEQRQEKAQTTAPLSKNSNALSDETDTHSDTDEPEDEDEAEPAEEQDFQSQKIPNQYYPYHRHRHHRKPKHDFPSFGRQSSWFSSPFDWM
eukprot:CAMPEP_0202725770 /NCGR_PEP_ID=MMETSP1385-20130828/184272_1 /ASSEMBLY_ACC=CAM_ASM_000861 /TAXON_ID=933848 /ORGANISM="Elphidium margaritaceum" /LENGTH=209 /DNA_ID=CAMNT_0049391975 /DNA_START=95 /DNA_END=724 /DNA_ORIENTATION=-